MKRQKYKTGSHDSASLVSHRLMVNLTQPAMLCFGKVPEDPAFRHHFLQVMSHLQAYKEVFGLYDKCSTIINLTNIIQLVTMLVR